MFIGQYRHMLDEKNRVIVPAKFRKNLRKGAILSLGYNCLTLSDSADFDAILKELSDKKAHQRLLSSTAGEAEFDASGRIQLPAYLVDELPELKDSRELVIIGVGNRIEIWPRARWQTYFEANKPLLQE